MCNFTRSHSLFLFLASAVILATGCGSQTSHPNQLNAFDGASYDSLTLAHGALASLRAQVASSYPKYITVFNQADATYASAYDAYALYRTNPGDQAAVSVAIENLTVSIIALEHSFQSDIDPSPKAAENIQKQAHTLLVRAAGHNTIISDILTELEIAAAIARTIPAAQPAAGIASMIIAATTNALAAEMATAGHPIDLSVIQPVPSI